MAAPRVHQKLSVAVAMICAAHVTSAFITATAAVARGDSPEDYVGLHNAARAAAGAGPVAWDDEAARHAGKRAAARCTGLPSSPAAAGDATGRASYDENLFRGAPGKKVWAAADAVRAWTAPAAREHVQVLWPGSTKIGCARAVCAGGRGVVISCCYEPAVKEELKRAALSPNCRYNISGCYECPIC